MLNSDADPLPMVVVKLKEAKNHNQTPAGDEVEMNFEQIPNRPPLNPSKQLLLQKQTSSMFFYSKPGVNASTSFKRFPANPGSNKSGRPRSSRGMNKLAPHTTISMRRSGERGGSAFSYGAGLVEQSTLTVMNLET